MKCFEASSFDELDKYYKLIFNTNKKVIEEEFETILKNDLKLEKVKVTIKENEVIVSYYSTQKDKIYIVPWNFTLQVNHEYISVSIDEAVSLYMTWLINQKGYKIAILGIYPFPPYKKRRFNYDGLIIESSLEKCFKVLYSNPVIAYSDLDKSKTYNEKNREETKALLKELYDLRIKTASSYREEENKKEFLSHLLFYDNLIVKKEK